MPTRRLLSPWTPLALVVALLGGLAIWFGWPSGAGVEAGRSRGAGTGFLVSYVAAADRLDGLDRAEAEEQVRDWTRLALAAHLELDTAQLRDTSFDTLPARDPGFADLARQPVGPGRALLDARGVLHLLVPADDPHLDRTVGLLLDQHRTDSGADAPRTRLHRYTIDPATRTVRVETDESLATDTFRAERGYVRARIDDPERLKDFLARTKALSTLEVRGAEVWAGGWAWPDASGVPLTYEDVSVLQRGYAGSGGTTPGFSLDPGPPATKADLQAAIPGLGAELLDRVLADNWAGSPFASRDELADQVSAALHGDAPPPDRAKELGLPTDRVALWALDAVLHDRPAYSQARYDGGLEGTEVGMTLFYTDYVTKDWTHGVGTGVPARAVAGFVPDSAARTPWGHCVPAGEESEGESGRLWFGQHDAGFAFADDRVSIGAQSTRLFARSDGDGGTEVETSYAFGRGLRWWDRHYQAVADYEPQYQRLDQIMRWSGALEWLAGTSARLPRLPDAEIRSDLTFARWYQANGWLRERAQVHFVTPPSATGEALLAVPSPSFPDCGFDWISGGVSLGDLAARKEQAGRDFEAALPGQVDRAGLHEESSTYDPATGRGSIKDVSIDHKGSVVDSRQRNISTDGGKAAVETTADGREVVELGGLKILQARTEPRTARTEISASGGRVTQDATYQGHDLGGVTAVKEGGLVTVQWRRGVMDRVRGALEAVQDALATGPTTTPPTAVNDVLYNFTRPDGQVISRVGGQDAEWLAITGDLPPPGGTTALRLGAPAPQGGPLFFTSTLGPHPDMPKGQWMEVTPAAPGRAAHARLARPPAGDSPAVAVRTRDGRDTTLRFSDDGLPLVRTDDPLVGFNGTVEGAALVDLARIGAVLSGREPGAATCVLDGMAGVGKTALALRAAWDAEAGFPDGCLFFDLRGHAPDVVEVSGDEALDRLLRALGVPAADVPRDADVRANLYRDRLRGKRMLIVFDDVRSARQVAPLLPAEPRCRVLITSRNRLNALDDAVHITVEELPAPDAIALFRSIAGDRVSEEDPNVSRVVDHCGRLPLAVRIAAARFRATPMWTLDEFARRLADEADRLSVLDDGERSVTAAFSLSYQGLPEDQRRLLALLALHPGRDVGARAAAALAGLRTAEVERLLIRLDDAHLITRRPGGRAALHELVRVFAVDHALPGVPDREAATGRLLDHVLAQTALGDAVISPRRYRPPLELADPPPGAEDFADREAALAWLEAEWPNLVALCGVAAARGDHRRCWQLAFLLRDYFFHAKRWTPWVQTHELAAAAARVEGDLPALAITLGNLGMAHVERGELDTASARFRESLALFRDIGDEHGTANALSNLAWVAHYLGDHRAALREFGAALDFYRRTGSTRNAAITLRGIALAEVELGAHDDALRHAREAHDQARTLDLRLDVMMALNCLAWACFRAGRHDRAVDHYQEAVSMGESPYELARALTGMGNTAAATGDAEAARRWWEEADAAHRLLEPTMVGESQARRALGG